MLDSLQTLCNTAKATMCQALNNQHLTCIIYLILSDRYRESV